MKIFRDSKLDIENFFIKSKVYIVVVVNSRNMLDRKDKTFLDNDNFLWKYCHGLKIPHFMGNRRGEEKD